MDQELNKKPATILKPSHISVPLIFTVTIMTLVSQVSTLRLGKKKKKTESLLRVRPTAKWPTQDLNPDDLKLEPELINTGPQLKRKQGTRGARAMPIAPSGMPEGPSVSAKPLLSLKAEKAPDCRFCFPSASSERRLRHSGVQRGPRPQGTETPQVGPRESATPRGASGGGPHQSLSHSGQPSARWCGLHRMFKEISELVSRI